MWVDGLPEKFHGKPVEEPRDLGTLADPSLELFFTATGADIRTGDTPEAFYHRGEDYIQMPAIATFHSANRYYATLAHEVCHWTGHKSRLDRFSRFVDRAAYAFEELIAELGNCMVCAQIGVEPDFEQSGAYIKSWLRALQDDKRMIFKAATEAQAAADLVMQAHDRLNEGTEKRAAA